MHIPKAFTVTRDLTMLVKTDEIHISISLKIVHLMPKIRWNLQHWYHLHSTQHSNHIAVYCLEMNSRPIKYNTLSIILPLVELLRIIYPES